MAKKVATLAQTFFLGY